MLVLKNAIQLIELKKQSPLATNLQSVYFLIQLYETFFFTIFILL